MFILNEYMIT